MTKQSPPPEDADRLLSLGQSIVTVFSERREDLNLCRQAEASLRASLEAATYGVDRYMAVVAAARKSRVAVRFLKEAGTLCDRNIQQLRRCVTKSIAYLCRRMADRDLAFNL